MLFESSYITTASSPHPLKVRRPGQVHTAAGPAVCSPKKPPSISEIPIHRQNDSEDNNSALPNPAENNNMRCDRATEIGQVLLQCERCFFSVGIPWFPPTKKTRMLRKGCREPLGEFLQTALVTSTTTQLELYLTDLENEDSSEEFSRLLGIEISSVVERYSFVILFAMIALLVSLFGGNALNMQHEAKLLVAIGFTSLAAMLAERLSRDASRRKSFIVLIQDELKRRRGLDNPTLTRLPIYTIVITGSN